ncbi:DUF2149 domain-containing protein [Allorhodopirellula heiligendammensis]|uniref:DUF2149 domain-containing protein n=1 Tax=Allorhodopirellula heiligendammensis TaxID=2714739 RepID=A0A5C6BV22_9BACT|nr:DUF2149 domain-containing protein [Allorhodopirellula heiligendammensis]TWU15291.1 hypothetical protein Poly21_24860 [Allorhodopirellula heiligendammensis]|tara:strand:- start:1375 stop:1707 length:333 start_codon:yes stop_codon:yes gene_type:complete
MSDRRIKILDDEDTDPMLSSINLVDVFLVAMAMLMIGLMRHPMTEMMHGDFTLIRNEGESSMEIVVREGETLTRFQSTGSSSEGTGTAAGTAYRMKDGSMVYVPHKEEGH